MKMKIKVKNGGNESALVRLKRHVHEKGSKWTRQRELIASVFLYERSHVTAEQLYEKVKKKDPSVGYSTIYRTLKLIVSAGLGSERKLRPNESVFEPDIVGEHHDHIVCKKCGKIVEFGSAKIEELEKQVAQDKDFEIVEHRLVLYGYCSKCRSERRRR